MIELLLKSSIAIGIAFLFYKLLLQQESFFTTNRFYLLGCIALAFALPYVTLPKLINQQGYLAALFEQESALKTTPVTEGAAKENIMNAGQLAATENLEKTAQAAETRQQNASSALPQQRPESVGTQAVVTEEQAGSEGFSLMFWLLMLYLFGLAIFTLSLLFQVSNVVYKIITATDKIQDGDCVIVNTATKQAPCSFFKYIFIYPDDYDYETYEQIIAHEKVHARLGHSLDLLIAEIAVIILWFNPLIWLFKREIEKNIEYQTDAELLEKEQVRRDQYQLNLLQIAVPNKPLNITTNYNQSLIKQRIMMMNAKRSTPHAYWKYAFMVPLFFGLLLLLNEPATSQNKIEKEAAFEVNQISKIKENISENIKETIVPREVQSGKTTITSNREPGPLREPLPFVEPLPKPNSKPVEKQQEIKRETSRGLSVNRNSKQTDMSEGYWYSNREKGQYCIQFKGSKESNNWNMSECFDASAFQKKGNDTFVMTKEAGTLQLTGNLDAEVGQGKYKFTENASFSKYLADNNIASRDKNLMFFLFFGDVSKNYVAFLTKEYGSVNGDRLLELAIHGVPEQSFKNYIALFQKHSNKKPSIQEVVEAKIHGIDETYVQEIQKMGFKDLSLKKMMEAKIHGVNAAYVESLKSSGFDNLSIDRIIEAKIHGVKPESIKEMRALGFGDLGLKKIIELQIHDVDAAYIKELKAAGLTNLTVDQALEAKIHGLNAASIKEIRALGYKDLSLRDMMSARIHGVDAAFVEDLKKAGFANLSMNKVVEAKIHGINGNFIKQARQNGYNLNSIDKYISLKIHGSAMESLKEKD